jgi:hypothetical protein
VPLLVLWFVRRQIGRPTSVSSVKDTNCLT